MYFHVHGNIQVLENTKNCVLKHHRSTVFIKQTTIRKTTTKPNIHPAISEQDSNYICHLIWSLAKIFPMKSSLEKKKGILGIGLYTEEKE